MSMTLCPDNEMQALTQAMQKEQGEPLFQRIDGLLARYPDDARLYFVRGSVFAGAGRLIEAYRAFARAVEIAPDFTLARFQLGFFQLTSGEPENALDTWGRLDLLPDGHYLRGFVTGLRCLIRDDFAGAIAHLREGIRVNTENPPLSHDMQLIIDQVIPLAAAKQNEAGGGASETSLLLMQLSGRKN
ncbi:MAG: hypothetical protein ABUL42_00240 [Terricaulis silvestris]